MFYRETGQYKTSYAADMALFPIRQDRIGMALILLIAFVVIPLTMSSFTLSAVMIPILVFSLAAIGLNLLTGYTGLISLGTAGFMGVGAYACYKLTTWFPGVNIIVLILLSGFAAAAVGAIFGLPSLRIKGFYLTVATLAAQFFLSWCFVRVPWLVNYNISNAIEVPTRTMFDIPITGPNATPVTRYLVVLSIVGLHDLDRIESRARPHRAKLDGGARHGYRRRTDRHPALSHQAARLCGVVLLLRRCRCADGISVAWRSRGRQLQYQPVLHHPVHGDHRRARQPDRLVLRRSLHLGSADPAEAGCRSFSASPSSPPPWNISSSWW